MDTSLNSYQTKYVKNKLGISLFSTLIILSISFANTGLLLGKATLYLSYLSMIFILPIALKKITIFNKGIIIWGMTLSVYNVMVSLLIFENFESVYNGLLFSGIVFIVLLFSNLKVDIQTLEYLTTIMATVSKTLLVLYIISIEIIGYQWWISGSSYLFLFSYFVFTDKKTKLLTKIIYIFLWSFLLFIEGQRTFLLLMPVLISLFLLWNVIKKRKFFYNLFLFLILILLIVIPIVYVMLSFSTYRVQLDQIAIQYTDSRFFSYRDIIWYELFRYYLDQGILFGAGHHVSPQFVFGYEHSAHNTYVSILTRSGIVGFSLFYLFIMSIWQALYLNKENRFVIMSSIFLVVTLLKQSSEVSLVGNNVALGLVNWLIIIFGLLYSNSDKNRSKEEY